MGCVWYLPVFSRHVKEFRMGLHREVGPVLSQVDPTLARARSWGLKLAKSYIKRQRGYFFFFLPLSSKWKFVLVPSAVHLPGQEMLWLLVQKWGKRCWGGQNIHLCCMWSVGWADLSGRWLPLSMQKSQFKCWKQPCYHRSPILPCQASLEVSTLVQLSLKSGRKPGKSWSWAQTCS